MTLEPAEALLLRSWRASTRIAALPEAVRPANRAGGYEVAAKLAELTGDRVAGWKIAATSTAGQKHINVDEPLIGRIFEKRLLAAGAEVQLGDNIMKVAEAEF
ncbi:MAG: 2-keto-4-pentenoate hydratase, partial [Aestuariivirga sp.]